MSAKQPNNQRQQQQLYDVLLVQLLYLGLSLLGSCLVLRWGLKQIDPDKKVHQLAEMQRVYLEKKLKRKLGKLNRYEMELAAQCLIAPEEQDTSMANIGGLDDVKKAIQKRIVLPLEYPEAYNNHLLRQTRGLLLYGPPGTGKTMLAKALARESGSVFLNVLPSHIQSKWFGDTQKYVSAIFSLARKLQPCIVFIDEVDAVLGKRRANEHEVTVSMKTEFMQLWDGLTTGRNDRILVFGATNRPDNLDEAVLRRFSVQYEVGKPGTAQRADILKVILQRYHREEPAGVEARLLNNHVEVDGKRPLDKLAEKTKDFSGADLYNMCCTAASDAAHDAAHEVGQPTAIQAPTLTFEMLMKTARATRPSNAAATEYGHRAGVSDQRQSLIDLVEVVWSVQQMATHIGVQNMHAQRAAQFGNGTGMNGHADFNTYDPNAPEDDDNNGHEEDGDNNHH